VTVLGSCAGTVVLDDVGALPATEEDVLVEVFADSAAVTRSDGSFRREGMPVAITPATMATTTNNAYVSPRERIGG
jgi:hypothetical protein